MPRCVVMMKSVIDDFAVAEKDHLWLDRLFFLTL
tara:strand:+ start:645 stop:746 length:102 start_codon:yes stop_codon:yes gene_type:complete